MEMPNGKSVDVGKSLPRALRNIHANTTSDAKNAWSVWAPRSESTPFRDAITEADWRIGARMDSGASMPKAFARESPEMRYSLGKLGRHVAGKEGNKAKGRRIKNAMSKADDVEDLPIPEWARNAWSMAPTRIVSPLDMYAGSALAAEGYRKVTGKRVWPWQRGKVKAGGLEMAQGRAMTYSPLGSGRIQ